MSDVHAVPQAEPVPAPVQSEFEITEVVRQLSHELRQPLSTMESIAYYLSMVVPTHDMRVRQQVEKLQRLVDQMNWVLADAVHFFQATPPNPQTLDLNELITETVNGEQQDKALLHVTLSDRKALVEMDPSQARHCVESLIGLVRKWAHGEVRVSTQHVDSEVHIRVSAPQLRIQSADASLIFEPFRPHAPAGAGLAFASVRRIAEASGGRAGVELSEPRGVTVSVELPHVA